MECHWIHREVKGGAKAKGTWEIGLLGRGLVWEYECILGEDVGDNRQQPDNIVCMLFSFFFCCFVLLFESRFLCVALELTL